MIANPSFPTEVSLRDSHVQEWSISEVGVYDKLIAMVRVPIFVWNIF